MKKIMMTIIAMTLISTSAFASCKSDSLKMSRLASSAVELKDTAYEKYFAAKDLYYDGHSNFAQIALDSGYENVDEAYELSDEVDFLAFHSSYNCSEKFKKRAERLLRKVENNITQLENVLKLLERLSEKL